MGAGQAHEDRYQWGSDVARVKIFLNGKEVEVEEGVTILEAARECGVEIPTLCHDEQLDPFTSCWVCAVKLEGMRRYVPSCGTRVASGMKVWTDTEDVHAVRRMALELLLSNHRGDCIAPCKVACPAGVDVQGYIALIAQGQYREATKLVKEVNPFPLAIGRVCPRPCEGECRRNAVDSPVGIDYLKRFAADWDIANGTPYSPTVAPKTGRRVAAVGAGPGSLTAAYYLAQMGHDVTVFEALPAPGGMLRYGIPEYRLPKKILDEEIGLITTLGVELVCGKALGRDFSLASLFEDGYEAVYLGLGAMGSRRMKVPGEELDGVWAGTEFLKDVTLGKDVAIGRRVAIIGGGNTAIDASRTCLRLGAEEVTIVYRRSRTEMPAWDVEVDAAQEEGVRMHFLAAPTAIEGDGRCERVTCIRMELGEPDSSGRRRPVPIEGSEFTLEVDNVIAAIGQVPDLASVSDTAADDPESLEAKLELTRWGTIVADELSGATAVPGVYAGGDVVSGAATAIEAIAAGGRAAEAIDRQFRGEEIRIEEPYFNIHKERWDAIPSEEIEHVERKPRQEMPELPLEERLSSFREVELGYSEEAALEEASRCLECGCIEAFTCKLRQYAAEYEASADAFGGDSLREAADERHPFVRVEPEKCILCARCIRICEDVQGAAALGFFARGFAAQMKPSLGLPLAETTCESCGQCISSCPTAALSAKTELPKPGPWALASTESTCMFCGTGCAVRLDAVGERLVKVAPVAGSSVSDGNLCVRGRFGTPLVRGGDRIREPAIRENGAFAGASWDDALARAAAGIREVADVHGGPSVAVAGSPRLTNEEAYWLQKLGRAGLGTPAVGSFGLQMEEPVFGALRSATGFAASTAGFDELRSADVILLLDSDVAEEQTVAGIAVRKAVGRGARLVVFSPEETRMAALADTWIRVPRDSYGDTLQAMIEAVSGGAGGGSGDIVEAARAFAGAARAVLVANACSFASANAARDAGLAVELAERAGKLSGEGSGILFLRMRANGQGATDAGLTPAALPGHVPPGDERGSAALAKLYGGDLPPVDGSPTDLFEAIESGVVRGAIIVGEDPVGGASDPERVAKALRKLEFLVVADAVPTATTELANVVVPFGTFAEARGTCTNSERRVQRVDGPFDDPAGRGGLAILADLGRALGVEMGEPDDSSVRAEMVAALGDIAFPAEVGPGAGRRWTANGTARALSRRGAGRPDDGAPAVRFDPRFTDALERRISARADDLGLRSHVVRRPGVCA